ncbi:hypothetical protein [Neisseria sp. CCUG12390]|uniref:hypothetical protein n=1 Tax=Neisseria sp. CCUG12390 TaxID=3392035 RepID=UPI003A0FE919
MTTPIFTRLAAIGIAAAVGLGGCAVSDDPAVNTIATTAAVGTAASLLYYSLDDGYYYDDGYNRMPRTYRPAYDSRVRRIDSMRDYRRRYPLGTRTVQHRQNRILQERIERQREHDRLLHNRLDQQRERNRLLQNRFNREREHDRLMRQRMEEQRLRERMPQQRSKHLIRDSLDRQRVLERQRRDQRFHIRHPPVRTPQHTNQRRHPWWEQNRR